jgi:hypothetical protein
MCLDNFWLQKSHNKFNLKNENTGKCSTPDVYLAKGGICSTLYYLSTTTFGVECGKWSVIGGATLVA